jgi:hypothetical protein
MKQQTSGFDIAYLVYVSRYVGMKRLIAAFFIFIFISAKGANCGVP